MLWQHDWEQPIGVYTEAHEDDHGLFVRGQLALNTQKGREAHELLTMKALEGLSIGFATIRDEIDRSTGVRTLKELDLWEVSPVTFPMNERAAVTSVKARISRGELVSKRELECLLRDAGLSKHDAQALIATGYDGLRLRDADDDIDADAIKRAMEALK